MEVLHRLTASDLLQGYDSRSFSPLEVVDALATRIAAVDPTARAFTALALEQARANAADSAERWTSGRARRLEGIPFAVKDLIDTAGVETSYGSTMFRDHVPDRDAAAVAALREAGAILLGKTTTHEFAWGLTGWNPPFSAGRNPWDPARVTGGSSAGSAAAVALDLVPIALGTDTAGSIRVPAAWCGVVGLKPTYARIPVAGVFPLAPSLDHVGFFSRSPADARLLVGLFGDLPSRHSASGFRIGVSSDLAQVPLSDDVAASFLNALDLFEQVGAERVDLALPGAADHRGTHGTIQLAEANHTHRHRGLWPGRRDGYGADVAGRLALSDGVDLDQVIDAIEARERLRAEVLDAFQHVDVLLNPVAPCGPPACGSDEVDHRGERRPLRDLVLPFTTMQNLFGLPACAVRAGFDSAGMPVAVQVTGPPGGEAVVLDAADALFRATAEVQERRPRDPG